MLKDLELEYFDMKKELTKVVIGLIVLIIGILAFYLIPKTILLIIGGIIVILVFSYMIGELILAIINSIKEDTNKG